MQGTDSRKRRRERVLEDDPPRASGRRLTELLRPAIIKAVRSAGVLAAYLPFVLSASGEEFPSRPITLVVPYAAGGNVDQSARIIQTAMAKKLGQPVLIENKPGAAGQIGGSFVARSEPDGYTLFFAANGPILYVSLTTERPLYRWQQAFAPVSMVSSSPTVLLVRNTLPVATARDLLAYAKANPTKFTMATGGVASLNHLMSELLQQRTNISWAQIHYRGNAPALNDLVGGHVDAEIGLLSDSLSQIQAGNVRALAILGKERASVLPDVPTMAEAGLPALEGDNFVGVLAPAGTPPEIVEKLSGAVRYALREKAVQDQFSALGVAPKGTTPEEFERFLMGETGKWEDVVKKAHIRIDN